MIKKRKDVFLLCILLMLFMSCQETYSPGPETVNTIYHANGADNGSIPIINNTGFQSGATFTILGNEGNLTRNGYTFLCWNTKADGTGTDYYEGDKVVIYDVSLDLYAKWTQINLYTVEFDSNGGEATIVIMYLPGNSLVVEPPIPVREDYVFIGWYTETEPDVLWNFENDLITENLILKAKWEPTPSKVGQTGPGNGYIFYDDRWGYDFDSSGIISEDEKNLMEGKDYLEAAFETWNGPAEDERAEYGTFNYDIPEIINRDCPYNMSDPDGVIRATLGLGEQDTYYILQALEETHETGKAAQICVAYNGAGFNDWHMPSIGELIFMLHYKDEIHLEDHRYWSTTERNSQVALNGFYSGASKPNHDYIRPIRSF